MAPKYLAGAHTPTSGADNRAVAKICRTVRTFMSSTEKAALPPQAGFTSTENINTKKEKPLCLKAILIFRLRKIQKKEQSNRSRDEETTFNSPCFTFVFRGKCPTRPTLYPVHV